MTSTADAIFSLEYHDYWGQRGGAERETERPRERGSETAREMQGWVCLSTRHVIIV